VFQQMALFLEDFTEKAKTQNLCIAPRRKDAKKVKSNINCAVAQKTTEI
jgi:hypothetical protein